MTDLILTFRMQPSKMASNYYCWNCVANQIAKDRRDKCKWADKCAKCKWTDSLVTARYYPRDGCGGKYAGRVAPIRRSIPQNVNITSVLELREHMMCKCGGPATCRYCCA